jgi:hypothetical protein
MKNNLILHCGGRSVEIDALKSVVTPRATETHVPIPHIEFVDTVSNELGARGFGVTERNHALSGVDDARYFGVWNIQHPDSIEAEEGGWGWSLALRNSHDKTFPLGLAAGSRVFACDNLAFSGEIQASRKHTGRALEDMPKLIGGVIVKLMAQYKVMVDGYDIWKGCEIDDRDAADAVVRLAESGAITCNQVVPVMREWRHPEHEEFKARSAWSLFNAVTSVTGSRSMSPDTCLRRGEGLHGFFAGRYGFGKTVEV